MFFMQSAASTFNEDSVVAQCDEGINFTKEVTGGGVCADVSITFIDKAGQFGEDINKIFYNFFPRVAGKNARKRGRTDP